ncbi:MAG: DUF721 domain-containing protein [Actinomycetota bacterium]
MSETSNFPTRLRDVLHSMSRGLGLEDPLEVARLWREWPALVGDDIARHAHPSSLKRGVLRIRTDSSMWATELGYLAEHIRKQANQLLGRELIRTVKIWTSPEPARPRDKGEAHVIPPPLQPASRAADTKRDPAAALEGARRAWSRRSRGRPV